MKIKLFDRITKFGAVTLLSLGGISYERCDGEFIQDVLNVSCENRGYDLRTEEGIEQYYDCTGYDPHPAGNALYG